MKAIRNRILYGACLVLALLAGAIIVRSMDLSLTGVVFIALALGAGVAGFVAVVALLARGKRAKNPS